MNLKTEHMISLWSLGIPEIYRKFLPNENFYAIREETLITCNDCYLCKKNHDYDLVKCCTYFPEFPNYLIGAVLSGEKIFAYSKEVVSNLIGSKKGITPYGITPSLAYKSLRNQADKDYGEKNEWPAKLILDLACPFLEKGNCSIYPFREHLCYSFHCYSVGGEEGSNWWKEIDLYFYEVEKILTEYAIQALGYNSEKKTASDWWNETLEDPDGIVNQKMYKEIWGTWSGRESEFYKACFEIVSQLSRQSFDKIAQDRLKPFNNALIAKNKQYLSPDIPPMLIFSEEIEIEEKANQVTFSTEWGTCTVPNLVYHLLKKFDGGMNWKEIQEKISPFGIDFERDYLQSLYQFRVLQPKTEEITLE